MKFTVYIVFILQRMLKQMLRNFSIKYLYHFFIVLQAVWFTSSQGLDGPVYGAADQWNGVGIFFDSFDNDGKVGVK